MESPRNWYIKKLILFAAVLIFLPAIINASKCFALKGYLDGLPCGCMYDRRGGNFTFKHSDFYNLTNTDIEAKASYVNGIGGNYERQCLLREDHQLYCPFDKETGIVYKRNATVTIRFKKDGSIKTTTFSKNGFVRNCICDDNITPVLTVKQSSWNSLELTWDKPDYIMKSFTHSVYYVMNGHLVEGNDRLTSKASFEHLKPKKFNDQIRVCLRTNTAGLCSSVRDVCQNITMSSYFYYKHFTFNEDENESCKVTEDDVQLKWYVSNMKDINDLGFTFKIGMFKKDKTLFKTISTNKTSWKHVMSETFREDLHYIEVSLCLAPPGECSEKRILKCDKPLSLSMSDYLKYVGIGVLLAIVLVVVLFKGVLQSRFRRPVMGRADTEPVDSNDINLGDSTITISEQYEEIKANTFYCEEERFDSLDFGAKDTKA